MTKYTESLNRSKKNDNIPRTIDKERYEGDDLDKTTYYCPYCRRNLTLVNRETGEYKCAIDEIPFYPREDDNVRRADVVDIPEDPEDKEVLISWTPDPLADYYKQKKPEYQGAFKTLQDRGIHITSYTERSGDGHITSFWNDKSNSSDPQHKRLPRPFKQREE